MAGFYSATRDRLMPPLRGQLLRRRVQVDVRPCSPTFGRRVAVELNDENRRQLWIPRGLAHGFIVRSESADFCYKCDELYSPVDEKIRSWNDPELAIDWAKPAPTISARDRAGQTLAQLEGLSAIRVQLMRVLLTGVTGQVGAALVPRLRLRALSR